MIKRLLWLFALCFLLFELFSPTPARAQSGNKAGINLAGEASKDTFKRAANIVGEGGWITIMVFSNGVSANCKGTLQEFFDLTNAGEAPKVNVIVRRWNEGGIPDPNEFAEMYADLNTYGQVVFDMPLNEPSLEGGTPEDVLSYINQSQQALQSRGILGSKIRMLSPMFNQFGGGVGFAQSLKNLDANFFNKFFGAAMNPYVLYNSGGNLAAPSDPARNGTGYREILRQMGWNNYGTVPVFAVEAGVFVAGNLRPTYPPSEPVASIFPDFLNYAYSAWYADGDFWAATPLAYDPHKYPYDLYLLRDPWAGQMSSHRRSGSTITHQPYGTNNGPGATTEVSDCPGFAQRGCEDPRDGPKDKGCYGSTLRKDSPDEKNIIWDIIGWIGRVVPIFRWGGDTPIEVTEVTIPIEYDLRKLLGIFPGGTPAVINEETLTHFQSGVLPKLTPPGPPLERLHQNLISHLEDYSRGELDVTSCKAPSSKDIEIAVPDVWGLKNTAENLFSYLVKIPQSSSATSSRNDYQVSTAATEELGFEPQVLSATSISSCKQKNSLAATNSSEAGSDTKEPASATDFDSRTTAALAQTGSVLGDEPPSGCYGPGGCPNKTDAPDKPVCLTDEGKGRLELIDEEGDECEIEPPESRTCTVDDVANLRPPQPPCPAGPDLPICTTAGQTFQCNQEIPDCDQASENDLSMPPKISFLGDYVPDIISIYHIFKTPGLRERDLYGEGQIEWDYQLARTSISSCPERTDTGKCVDKILYRKLGTVECLEDYVKRALSPPGHGLTPKEGCFD